MKVGITFSTFDLFHAGHVVMLEEAKSKCHKLIVGLQVDPTIDRPHKNKPVQSVTERYLQLRACKFVDEIIPYSTEADLVDLLGVVRPDVRILGDEYADKDFTGREFCVANGIELYFNSRLHTYSSSSLRERTFKAEQTNQ